MKKKVKETIIYSVLIVTVFILPILSCYFVINIYNKFNSIYENTKHLMNLPLVELHTKSKDMRITGYLPTGNKTALGEDVIVGRTAAVSRDCIEFLGSDVYVLGHGVFRVNDLTNARLDEEFGMCTLDIAVPTKEDVYRIGNNTSTVVRIN